MNLKLDLSKFKVIGSDKKTTTMQHVDGHKMTIAHHALSPKVRQQLASLPRVKMANGGEVDDSSDNSTQTVGSMIGYPGSPKPTPAPKGYADGGEVASEDIPYDKLLPQEAADQTPYGTPPSAPSDPIAASVDNSDSAATPATDPSSGGMPVNPDAAMAPPGSAPAPQAPVAPPMAPNANPSAPQMAPSGPVKDEAQSGNEVDNAYNEKLQGINNEAKDMGALATQQSKMMLTNAAAQQSTLDTVQAQHAKLNDMVDKTIQDVKEGHIDPKHIWADKTVGQKIGAGIGLLLGGMGSAMLHQKNPVLEMMNNAIDRDIDAQKANLNNKYSMLGVLSKHLGDVNDAAIVEKNIKTGLVGDQIAAQAAKMQPGLLRDRAMQQAADFKLSAAPMLQQMALRRSAAQAGQQGDPAAMISYLRVANPTMASEMEKRYIPGVGMASVPVPDADRNNITERQNLLTSIGKVKDFAAKNSGSLDPRVINEGKALSNIALNQMRTATQQGVIKPSEIEFDRQLIDSDPTKFFGKLRTDPKYKVVESWARDELNTKRQQYGLPGVPETQSQAMSQPQTAMRNGVQYQKVAGGWSRVK